MVEEMLAVRNIEVTGETVRRRAVQFGLLATHLQAAQKTWAHATRADRRHPQKLRGGPQDMGITFENRQHKRLNNRAENSHQPTRVREKVMRRFKSPCQLQRFLSVHDQVANQFRNCRYYRDAK